MFGQASPHALGSFMKDWHIARDQPTLLVFPEFVAPGEPPSPIGRLAMAKRSNEEKLFTALLSMHQYVTPYVHRHNADLLCRSNALHRVYCLVLINVLHESEYKGRRDGGMEGGRERERGVTGVICYVLMDGMGLWLWLRPTIFRGSPQRHHDGRDAPPAPG